MLTKNTRLLTRQGATKLHNLQGSEKLGQWNLTQRLTYREAEGFQLGHSPGKLINIHTADTSLSISGEAPFLLSTAKNRQHFYDLMLVEQPGTGAAIGIVSNFTNMIKLSLYKYQGSGISSKNKSASQVLEKYWILSRYEDREEAKYNLHLLACKYGLPVTELSAGWQGISRQSLTRIFSEVNTLEGLGRLKTDFDCIPDSIPHMTVKTLNEYAKSRSFFIDLCFFDTLDGHTLTVNHLATATSNREKMLSPVPNEKLTFTNVTDALSHIEKNFSGKYVDIQYRMKFKNYSFFIVPASWVRQGMALASYKDGELIKPLVLEIEKVKSSTLLYRILCKKQTTLIANDIIIPSDLTRWWTL